MSLGTKGRVAAVAILLLAGEAQACRRASSEPTPPQVGATAVAPTAARAEWSSYAFTAAEKAAVDEFLRRNPSLRVATDADRLVSRDEDGGFQNVYGIYHPYFVRGDVNDDGILDFALAFVRRDSSASLPWFSVAVFTGRGSLAVGPAFDPGAFLERDVSLAHGDLSIDRDVIVITPDLTDEAVRRYRWDPARRSYIFLREGSGDVETPEASRT